MGIGDWGLGKTYKPMAFFGCIAFALAILSIAFFLPVFFKYLQTGLVRNFPTLIVCGFTMMAAIQSFFAGMQLQTAVQKNRQDFEMELHRTRNEKILLKGM